MRTDDPPATRGEQFKETQRVHLDLREPPTREEAGLAEGRGTLIVERRRGGMLDVALTLPNGKVLAVPAIGVILTTAPAADPSGPVERIVVNRSEPDVASARDAVLADAAVLGLDAGEVARYFEGVRPGARITRVFEQRVGYLRASVDVRHDPVNGAYADVHYTLSWGSVLDLGTPSP